MKCAREGCDNVGTHRPVILLLPEGMPAHPDPARLQLGIVVCRKHQDVPASDFITDEGWQMIVETFAAVGRAKPARETAGLVWIRA